MSTRGYWWVWMMDGSHTSLCRPADVKDCVKTTGLLYNSKLLRKRKRKSRCRWWISSRFDKVWFIRVIKDIMSATSSNSGNTTGLFDVRCGLYFTCPLTSWLWIPARDDVLWTVGWMNWLISRSEQVLWLHVVREFHLNHRGISIYRFEKKTW